MKPGEFPAQRLTLVAGSRNGLLLGDAAARRLKLQPGSTIRVPQAVEGTRQLGLSDRAGMMIGVALLACTLLYIVPWTSVLGAILLVGYLGGAVFVHVHKGEHGQMWTPVVVGVLLWLGLLLREPRLRALLPFRR